MSKDIYDEENVVPNNWVKFTLIGDNINGTLISVREVKSTLPGKEGELQKIYEIKADGGSFHDVDGNKKPIKPPIEIKEGDYWNVGGGFVVDNQLRNVRLGQKVGIKFTDEKPNKTKGFNPTKIKKVYVPKDSNGLPLVDQEWLDEKQEQSEKAEE